MSGPGPIGGYVHPAGEIELNIGRPVTRIRVTNTGDRPIQVGSHYHFGEVNRALRFARLDAYGPRLAIPAGPAVRVEPGDTRDVELVPFAGHRVVTGCHGLVGGELDRAGGRKAFAEAARVRGFHVGSEPDEPDEPG
ncbi:MAG: hypothetical protein NVS9B8_17370 [Candidatus Limnocylindrales bacterium]